MKIYALPVALVATLLSFAALAAPTVAAPITLAADTIITVHPSLSGASSNHGSDDFLLATFPSGFNTYPLLRFDITPGTVFTGGATLELFCNRLFEGGVSGIGLHTVNVAWQENTVTWNSLGGAYSGAAFAQNSNGIVAGTWTQWTIPQNILQGWANNPATNNGIALIPTGGRDSIFDSRETVNGSAPRLTANAVAVPETNTALLVATGAILAAGVLRRRLR